MGYKDDQVLLICPEAKNETESRIFRRLETERRRSFLKTLCTIWLAATVGAFGIWFFVGYYDCWGNGRSAQNSTYKGSPEVPEVLLDNLPQALPLLADANMAPQCTNIPPGNKHDCWPESVGLSKDKCEQRGCCYQALLSPDMKGVPWCFYPTGYQGYMVQSVQTTSTGVKVKLQLSHPSGWPSDVNQLNLDVTYDSAERLHFKFYDPSTSRFEVPITLNNQGSGVPAAQTPFSVEIPSQGNFYIKVTRKSTGQVLFSTQGMTPLVFADQFLQIGTQLSSPFLYGLGEHRAAFLISTNWTKLGFWARDEPPHRDANLYGVHPFYLNIESDNKAHGVFLLNSNAMEVEVQPTPALTYRTTGGVLDFYVFAGTTPDNVVQQYTALIGRPFMPPYWSLGFHLCRWGYGGTEKFKAVIKRMRDAKMPYDTQWNDIDYMREHLDWTYDSSKYSGLPDIVNDLHQNGQHYIMIVDPGISNSQGAGMYPPYDDGLKMDIFIKKTDGSGPIIGTVWPGTTVFPDFFHPNTTQYWIQSAQNYHDIIPYDGMWIDMNEPSNFDAGSVSGCPDNNLENPPFKPPAVLGSQLKEKTLCASSRQFTSSHYNLHSLYGHSEAIATKRALDTIKGNKRSIVISRSTFPSTGVHAGHWLGDNNAHWEDTYYSIPGIMNFNLFGIPLVGADICGFNGDTTQELCTRWMQLGAFYPFMRNHNSIGLKDQDPAVFDQASQKIIRDALNLRYTLLPYLYTLFYRSHNDGLPVVRPLFFQYPESAYNATYMVDVQFMWGSALLITPVTSPSTTQGTGYLPKDRWYDWFNHSYIDSPGHFINFDLPMEHINLQVRGGCILPLQEPNVTTTLARKNNFILFATLDTQGSASGELYWDDGESRDSISSGMYNLIKFSLSKRALTSSVMLSGYSNEPMTLGQVYVLGVEVGPTSVTVNGRLVQPSSYLYQNKTLIVHGLSENLLQPLNITWLV